MLKFTSEHVSVGIGTRENGIDLAIQAEIVIAGPAAGRRCNRRHRKRLVRHSAARSALLAVK